MGECAHWSMMPKTTQVQVLLFYRTQWYVGTLLGFLLVVKLLCFVVSCMLLHVVASGLDCVPCQKVLVRADSLARYWCGL